MELVITAVNSITPVGIGADMTAASVRAGISHLIESSDYYDIEGNPITISPIDVLSDEEEESSRIGEIAKYSLEILLKKYFENKFDKGETSNLFLGVAPLTRPGPRYEGIKQEIAENLKDVAFKWFKNVTSQVIRTGNSSVIRSIQSAIQILKKNPLSVCILGGFDSLLALETLDWLEDKERLKSETFGRNHGLMPGEAVGFLTIETKTGAQSRGKNALAEIVGVGLANEPAPFLSDSPSKGEGLTEALKIALTESSSSPEDIDLVLGDLNGEFFRSKEWGYAEIRCFRGSSKVRQILHPADCMGSVGAASGAILLNIAVAAVSCCWVKGNVLVFCSDDNGECGTVILRGNLGL